MATVALTQLVLKDTILTIGTDAFQKAISQTIFTPSAETKTWAGLGANTVTDVGTATWTAQLDYMQDWDTTTSLSRYLYTNEGVTVPASFSPRSGSGPSFTTNLVITPGAIGGAVNEFATASISLGCSGKPLLVETGAVPTILSATPSGAAVTTLVTITGVRFTGVSGAAGVKFGATNATAYQVLSDTVIVASMPAGTAGAANITVTNGTGASTAFTYTRGA